MLNLYKQMKKLLNESAEIENDSVLAKKPETPPNYLEKLAEKHYDNTEITKHLVSNPSTPAKHLYNLAKKDSEHENLFWQNPVIPLLQLEKPDHFAKKMGEIHRYRNITDFDNSSHPLTFKTALNTTHNNPEVTSSLMNDERATADDIKNIIHLNKDSNTLQSAAEHEKTSPELLAHIMQQAEINQNNGKDASSVFNTIYKNKNTPGHVLDYGINNNLYTNDLLGNVMDLMYHDNMTPEMLHRYAQDPDKKDLHRLISDHWNAHPDTLDLLSNHPDKDIRYDVASNKNSSKQTLEKLVKDKDEQVNAMAKYKLGTSWG